MPPKGGKSRGRGVKKRKTNALPGEMKQVHDSSQEDPSEDPGQVIKHTEPVPEQPVSETGDTSDACSTASSAREGEKRRKKEDAEKKIYPWKETHKDVLAQFFGQHAVFYDKSLKRFKDKAYKMSLCDSFVRDTFVTAFPLDPIPSPDDVHAFYKNYRDRWVKISKKKSGQGMVRLTANDQWIRDNFAFVGPHIRKVSSVTSQSFGGLEEEADEIYSNSDSDAHAPVGKGKGIGKGCSNRRRHQTVASTSSMDPSAASMVQPQEPTGKSESQGMMSQVMSRLDDLVALRKSREPPMSRQEATVQSFAQYLQTLMYQITEGDLWDQYQVEAVQLVMRYQSRARQQKQQCDQYQQQYAPLQQPYPFRAPQPPNQFHQHQPQFQQSEPQFQPSQQLRRPTQQQIPSTNSGWFKPLMSSSQQPSPASGTSTELTPLQSTSANPFPGQSGSEDPDLNLSGLSNVSSLSVLVRAATDTIDQGNGNTSTLTTPGQSPCTKEPSTQ